MAFTFIYNLFNREFIVHSVYCILIVLFYYCCVIVASITTPLFTAFYALNILEVLRPSLYLAFYLSEYLAIAMYGVLLLLLC